MDRLTYLNPVAQADAWRADRNRGVGSSDAGVVLGWNHYTSVRQLWEEKTGIPREFKGDPERLHWGHMMEPVLLQEYAWRNGVEVLGRDWWGRPVIFRPKPGKPPMTATAKNCPAFPLMNPVTSPINPFMRANLDGVALTKDRRPALHIECKNTSVMNEEQYDWANMLPKKYLAQCLHTRTVLEDIGFRIQSELVALIGGNHYTQQRIFEERDLVEVLIERESRFWAYVESGEPPRLAAFPSVKPEELDNRVGIYANKPKNSGPPIPPPPAELTQAVLADVVDLGIGEKTYQGVTKKVPQVKLYFLLSERIPTEVEGVAISPKIAGKPFGVGKKFTNSTAKTAALRKFLEQWFGPLTDKQLEGKDGKGLDLEAMIGTNAMLNVGHFTPADDASRTYPVINGISKKMKGLADLEIPKDFVRLKDRKDEDDEQTGPSSTKDEDDDLPF